MRIALDLQVCQSIDTAFRGIGRYSLDLAASVVHTSGDACLAILNRNLQYRQAHVQHRLVLPQDRFRYLNPDPVFSEVAEQRRFAARQLNHLYATEKCDIVHCSSVFEYAAPNLQNFYPANDERIFSATLYDLIPLRLPERYLPTVAARKWYGDYLSVIRRQNLLLAISEATRREAIELLEFPEDRVINISSGVDGDLFRRLSMSVDEAESVQRRYGITRKFIMYTAGFDARKNMDGLIAAYARMPAQLQMEYQLVIVCSVPTGGDREIALWKRQAGVVNEDDVIFTGFVPDVDLVRLYNLTSLFVFPSLYEGFGLPIVEAVNCGAPALGSDCSSIVEILTDRIWRFDPKSADSMAERISVALTQTGLREQMVEAQRRHCARFTWENVAKNALSAWQDARAEQVKRQNRISCLPSAALELPYRGRRRIALFTPIPGQHSGIADFTARMVELLFDDFNFEIFTDADPALCTAFASKSGCAVFNHSEFASRHTAYDLIVYEVGNNVLHQYMFPYIRRFPGIVELHDFFIGHSLQSVPCNPTERLVGEIGIATILREGTFFVDQQESVWKWPYNRWLLDQPRVIVHSPYAERLFLEFYPQGFPARVSCLTLPPRHCPEVMDRSSFRRAYGVPESAYLIVSLGYVTQHKKIDVLMAAVQLVRRDKPDCDVWLMLAGDVSAPMREQITGNNPSEHLVVTGFLEEKDYWGAICHADVIVQLRERSRGECSGVVQDAMSVGRALVLNRCGSFGDLPDGVVRFVPCDCSVEQVAGVLSAFSDPSERACVEDAQRKYFDRECSSNVFRKRFREIIHDEILWGRSGNVGHMLRGVLQDDSSCGQLPVRQISNAFASFRPRRNRQRVLFDVTLFCEFHRKTGIQRVVSRIADEFHRSSLGFDVDLLPVSLKNDRLFYCRMSENSGLELATEWEALQGDVFLLLDSSWAYRERFRPMINEVHDLGGVVYSVVYDILPVLKPELFPADTLAVFEPWLKFAAENTEGFVCISRTVEDELRQYLIERKLIPRGRMLTLGHFYLGSDFCPASTRPKPMISFTGRVFLSVGTIEPRKNYPYMLEVMERVIAQNDDARWVIVGRRGWMMDEWIDALRGHRLCGKNIFYYSDADDALLGALYDRSEFLLNLSKGEGYGLPLIEASEKHKRVVCSDIPVFHEIDRFGFSYCPLDDSEIASNRIVTLLSDAHASTPPPGDAQCLFRWVDSARALLECIVGNRWDLIVG